MASEKNNISNTKGPGSNVKNDDQRINLYEDTIRIHHHQSLPIINYLGKGISSLFSQ